MERLRSWIDSETKSYVGVTEKSSVTSEAKANLYTWTLHEKDVKNSKLTRLADLTEAAGKLTAANYEKKADIGAALASSTASFQALEDGLAAKKKVLDADLQRELANDAAACDAFAKLVDEFQAFAHSVKTAMQV